MCEINTKEDLRVDYNYFFKTEPTVFLTGEVYQIMIPVSVKSLMYVCVGDRQFYDESNGILRSDVPIHRVNIPKREMEEAKKYKICVREVIERKPYFSETGLEFEFEFEFIPIQSGNISCYHIADSHNRINEAIHAVRKYEEKYGCIDFLLVNGDITNYTHKIEDYTNLYQLTGTITQGKIPVIFSRGNHDTRGIMAEKMEHYTPTYLGCSYFTFTLGNLWGLVLDCGEDKDDSHEEYGHTICCHEFRKRQTEFIKYIIQNASNEYAALGVDKRIVVCHIPFMKKREAPFNIEEPLYKTWSNLLIDNVKPHLAICGHEHELSFELNNENNEYPCPVIVGTKPIMIDENKDEFQYIGTAIQFNDNSLVIKCTDNFGNEFLSEDICI